MVTTVSAQELGTTHFCKTPGCVNEASSPVGRYSYCKPCQEHRARVTQVGATGSASTGAGAPIASGEKPKPAESYADRLAAMTRAARDVDRLRQRAANAAKKALDAKRDYDEAAAKFRAAVRELGEA